MIADVPAEFGQNLVDPNAYADWDVIHPTYKYLRDNVPIGRVSVPGFDPFWAVSRHADIQTVARQNEMFLNNGNRAGLSSKVAFAAQDLMADSIPALRALVNLDGGDHRTLRAVTAKWFMPKHVKPLEDNIRAIAREAIARVREGNGEIDFVKDIALGFPLSVIRSILGVPESDEPHLLRMTQTFLLPNDPDLALPSQTAEDRKPAMATSLEGLDLFMRYFADLTAERRAHPTDDVASIIANAEIAGALISDWDAISYYVTIATAGHDTTSASTAGAMWALCENPDILAAIRSDLSLVPGLVDEAIRWTTPIQHFMRTAAADTVVAGRKIAKGDWLMLCYPSGNRDESVFDEPYTFDPRRPIGRHVAFGHGGHHCLGLHLARLEMRIFFEELLPLIKTITFTGEPKRAASVFIGGPKTLPVKITFL